MTFYILLFFQLGLDIWQGWIRPLSIITLTDEEIFKQNLQNQIMQPDFHPAVIPSQRDLDAQSPKAGKVEKSTTFRSFYCCLVASLTYFCQWGFTQGGGG